MCSNGKSTTGVLEINTDDNTLKELKQLENPINFSQNLWKFNGSLFEGISFRGLRISYSLE